MITVDTIGRVRRAHIVRKKSIKAIARELRPARNTVRAKAETERRCGRRAQPMPQLGSYIAALEVMLAANWGRPKRERLTCQRISRGASAQWLPGQLRQRAPLQEINKRQQGRPSGRPFL